MFTYSWVLRFACSAVFFMCFVSGQLALAQNETPTSIHFTAEEDHQNMMDQLGIQELRPGFGGDEKAPNHANYDESKANPCPNLPDPLLMDNGQKVSTPEQWWKHRRPEIIQALEENVYGHIPENAPKVTWKVTITDKEIVGFRPVIAKRVIGHVDNSAYPQISVNISMTLVVPANAKGPVPVLIMFGPSVFPNPAQPTTDQMAQMNADLKALLVKNDPSLQAVFDEHPAYELIPPRPFVFPQRSANSDPPSIEQLIADGWGYAAIDPASIQPDNGTGLTRGIIGLVNKGQPRKPDQWGALRAWEWGASRALDYLETDQAVDAKYVGIEGVSRYGKAALVTLAFEQRFAIGLIGSSGKGGTTLLRRNFGEAVENLTNGGYYWMAGNFMKYGASKSKFGARTGCDLPVDSHELIALCAPRLVFISYGIPEKGDAHWLDHQGSLMAAVAAQPVFRLLGAKGMGVSDDYLSAKMPRVNEGLLDGQLAWRQHDGGHTDAPNVKYFLAWADRWIGHSAPSS